MTPILRVMRALEAPLEPVPPTPPPSRTPILDSLPPEHREEFLRVGAMCGDGPLAVEHALLQLKTATEAPLGGENLKTVLDFLNQIPEGTMTHYEETKQTVANANDIASTSNQDRHLAELAAVRALLGQIALNLAAIADRLDKNGGVNGG